MGETRLITPEQGPVVVEKKPAPPVQDVASAGASPLPSSPSRNIPLNELPVFPADPPAFAPPDDYVYSPSKPTPLQGPGQLLPPTPTHELTPTEEILFEKQTAQEMRMHPLAEQRLIMQEQDFNVELNYARSKAQQEHLEYLRQEEETARLQFQTDILRVKAQAWSDWQGQGGSGVSQDVWNVEWGKWEAGESARFEGAVSAWKVGEQFAFERQLEGWTFEQVQGFSSYKLDVLKTLPVSKQRVVPAGYVPYSETFFHEPTVVEYEAWESRAAHGATFGGLKRVPFTLEQISAYEKAEARAVHGASFGLLKHKSLAFQLVPQASRSDVTWKVDVKVAATIPFGSLEPPESFYRAAVLGKDFDMRDVARFAKTLTSRPVFGKDYDMRDVGAWGKKQTSPEFGKDYDMREVGVWAKSWGQTPEGLAYIAANQEQAAYEAKQAVSREFYSKLGYPQFGGKYEPFDTSMFPRGYDLLLSETGEGLQITPNIPRSFTEQVAESRGGLFSNWLSGVTGLSKQPGYTFMQDVAGAGQASLKPYVAEFIAPFEVAGVGVAKLLGVQGLQDAPSTALGSFFGSVKYGSAPLGLFERGLMGGNARALREAELLKSVSQPHSLYLSPSPELARYALRPGLLLSSLLGDVALLYTETKLIQGAGKAVHKIYDFTFKGSGLEKRVVNWAWNDPALGGFEKAGLEKVPVMDSSYLKGEGFISGYEESTGLSSALRGWVRGRLPLSELSVGLPTLPGYVPSAAEEALVKGSVGLGGYDTRWLPRLQAGLEFGDMLAAPGVSGFGLTVPAPLASVGVSNVGRVYAFELMKMPAGYASGFGKVGVSRHAGFLDDVGKYDLSMSKGGRFFKESMPSDFLAGFKQSEYPLLEITRHSGFKPASYVVESQFGFAKSGGSGLPVVAGLPLLKEMFSPKLETLRLQSLPLSESQLVSRQFLKAGSLPALSLSFAVPRLQTWATVAKASPMYMQRTSVASKMFRQPQFVVEESQYLSYPGEGVQQVVQPTQRFKTGEELFGLQRQRFITGLGQEQNPKTALGLLSGYSVKPSFSMVNRLDFSSVPNTLPRIPLLSYGLQLPKQSFSFAVSGLGSESTLFAGPKEMLQPKTGQALFVGQKPLRLQVQKTLLLNAPYAARQSFVLPDDLDYKRLKRRKTGKMKEYGFGKFLRVTPVMTSKEYRKMMLG